MPVYRLDERIAFPDPTLADENGLLAVGGDLSAERLLTAYALGIFPWYDEGLPILWHSPDPRCVFPIGELVVSRSTRKAARRYRVTFDTAFEEVIGACAETPREGQAGTWILDEMREAYANLFRLGFAHSVETWDEEGLAGGLYGVSLGAAFFGESMFHRRTNASKVALAALMERLEAWDFQLLDAQMPTPHLLSMGAAIWPRSRYLAALARALEAETRRGPWTGGV